MLNRRQLVRSVPLLAFLAIGSKSIGKSKGTKEAFFHHVFFWAKPGLSPDKLKKLESGIRSLGKIESVKSIHIGVPAATPDRDVVDHSYDYSLLVKFNDIKGHDMYQDHAIHTQFVTECQDLWIKVVVYDSRDI